MKLSEKLRNLAINRADRNNENPSFHGRSKPEEQVEWKLALEAEELEHKADLHDLHVDGWNN